MISSRVLLLLLGAYSRVSFAQECTLACNDRGTCKMGNANTTGIATGAIEGDDTNVNGMACVCEEGFTGVQCQRTTQFCDGSLHVCFHGGTCVEGEIQSTQSKVHVCDCRNATDAGIQFIGLYCEKESPNQETNPGAPRDDVTVCKVGTEEFCVHEGTCRTNLPNADVTNICDCPPEYTGYHCEFKRENLAASQTPEATAPNTCSVNCNAGTCQVGYRNATTVELDFNSTFDPTDHVTTFEHCRCPEGTSGAFCEKNHTVCGQLNCFHGSECTKNPATGANYCQCKSNLTTSFAGIGCQHHSTTFCTSSEGTNGHQFCTNNGQCTPAGDGIFSCSCTDGFQGPHCEFPSGIELPQEHQQCNLNCENGGQCKEGAKTHGVLSTVDINEIDNALNITKERHNEDFEHCVCPTGFAGLVCDTEAQVCEDGQHVCFHSSTCVPNGEDYKCNCQTSDSPTAGEYCQHKATEVCNAGKRQFCVNNGKCGTDDLCDCPTGYRGPHCEFIVKDPASAPTPDDDNVPVHVTKSLPRDYKDGANEMVIISAGIVAAVAVLLMVGLVVITAKSGEVLLEVGPPAPPMTAFPPSSPTRDIAAEDSAEAASGGADSDVPVTPLDSADDDDSDHVNELI